MVTATTPVAGGPYSTSCSGAVDSNYTIIYVNGVLTLNAAPLTITASPTSTTYGTAPAVTASYSGFVNTDSSSNLTTQPTCVSTVLATSPVSGSPYTGANTCSGAVDSNYTISYVAGTATVGKAALTITASSAPMTYGGTVPTITPSYAGFVNN